ncbi:lipopolysaccharide kinase InaA family protein [Myroides sp. LJL110]
MKRRIKIHKDYVHLREFIIETIQNFDKNGIVVQDNRNRVKIFSEPKSSDKYVVKSFEKVTLANKFIYRFFRKSKAQRSYENALELLNLSINSPFPVAYIEEYDTFSLQRSYFISAYQEHQEVNTCLQQDNNAEFLKAMGEFIFKLHQNRVFHYDLHVSNMLVTKGLDNKYVFHLIDINRLKFKRPTKKRMIKNLNRIFLPFNQYSIMIQAYADQQGVDAFTLAHKEMNFRVNHQLHVQSKRAFKNFYKKLWTRVSTC